MKSGLWLEKIVCANLTNLRGFSARKPFKIIKPGICWVTLRVMLVLDRGFIESGGRRQGWKYVNKERATQTTSKLVGNEMLIWMELKDCLCQFIILY